MPGNSYSILFMSKLIMRLESVISSSNTTYVCTSCGTINAVPVGDVHYVITVGKSVGVFNNM